MVVKIVGVRKLESKGRPAFNYSGLKDYSSYERESSDCEGQDVVSEFSYQDFGLHVGDVVDFQYEPGYQNRAKLIDVKMITPAEKVPKENK